MLGSPAEPKDVLYVMATNQEYGPHLRKRIAPVVTGVGPVEAAVAVAAILARLQASEQLPKLVVSLGSAGSRNLRQGQVYQATSVSYRDMDASPLGFERGVTPFLNLPPTIPLRPLVPGLSRATLSSGANVVAGEAYAVIPAEMVDMETYAVLRACQLFAVPMIALRGISDGAEELRQFSDWTRYLHIVDEGLAEAVDVMHASIQNGSLEQ